MTHPSLYIQLGPSRLAVSMTSLVREVSLFNISDFFVRL